MEIKAKTRTEQILVIMHILAWVAFVGYMIEAGAILVSLVGTYISPENAKNFYKGMDLYDLRQFSLQHYSAVASFMFSLSAMKAYTSFLVIKTLSNFNLSNPFTREVAVRFEKISYWLFDIWIVGMISNGYMAWLLKETGIQGQMFDGEIIFMVGVVFVFAQIFKRGVEIQSDNELTV